MCPTESTPNQEGFPLQEIVIAVELKEELINILSPLSPLLCSHWMMIE